MFLAVYQKPKCDDTTARVCSEGGPMSYRNMRSFYKAAYLEFPVWSARQGNVFAFGPVSAPSG